MRLFLSVVLLWSILLCQLFIENCHIFLLYLAKLCYEDWTMMTEKVEKWPCRHIPQMSSINWCILWHLSIPRETLPSMHDTDRKFPEWIFLYIACCFPVTSIYIFVHIRKTAGRYFKTCGIFFNSSDPNSSSCCFSFNQTFVWIWNQI
jgi:hypothetical protein